MTGDKESVKTVEYWTQNVVYKAFHLTPIPVRQSCVAREIEVERILSLRAVLCP